MIAIETEMPKNCYDCPMHIINCRKHGGGSFCTITRDDTDCHWNRERRDDNCPLVEIVTCKECKFNGNNICDIDGFEVTDDYFCGDGKRRE